MMIISSSFSFSAILFRPWLLTIRTDKLEGRRIVEVRRHYIFIVGQPSAKTFRRGEKKGEEPFPRLEPAASVFWLMLSTDFGLVAARNETKCRQGVIWLRRTRD